MSDGGLLLRAARVLRRRRVHGRYPERSAEAVNALGNIHTGAAILP